MKSACLFGAFLFLLAAVISLVRFCFDLWNHFHSPMAASIALDYGILWAALFAVIMCGLFLGVALLLGRLKL
jgi:hypothetical protein